MTVQVIPVRTTRPAQTEKTDSTAAAHQDLMAYNVKQVITISKILQIIQKSARSEIWADKRSYAFLVILQILLLWVLSYTVKSQVKALGSYNVIRGFVWA